MSLSIKAECFQASLYLIHGTILSATFIIILLLKEQGFRKIHFAKIIESVNGRTHLPVTSPNFHTSVKRPIASSHTCHSYRNGPMHKEKREEVNWKSHGQLSLLSPTAYFAPILA